MAVYGPGCHPQNSIWTSASLRSIYYFVGDRPVHKLPFGPKCHELFYNVFFRILSELVFCLRYTITKTCHLTDLQVLSIIQQIVHGTSGQMAVYGPVCHPQNSIWTEAKLRSIFLFVIHIANEKMY
jgi:hypothetical protein